MNPSTPHFSSILFLYFRPYTTTAIAAASATSRTDRDMPARSRRPRSCGQGHDGDAADHDKQGTRKHCNESPMRRHAVSSLALERVTEAFTERSAALRVDSVGLPPARYEGRRVGTEWCRACR